MNPLTNVKNIQKLNQRELELGVIGKKSWHDEYKDSAWVFIGGLPYDLTEGDIVCVFSQYGEIVNINLVRDKATGKSKGFAFLCYEDQRSTVLAVDNLNSIKLLGRIIRVDHVSDYKKPKEKGDEDEVTLQLRAEGCAPKVQTPSQTPSELSDEPPTIRPPPNTAKSKKAKREKKKKKKKKKKMKVTVKVERNSDSSSSSSSSSSSESSDSEDERHHQKRKVKAAAADRLEKLKREKEDSGYERALFGHRKSTDHSGREHRYDGDRKHTGSPDRSSDRHQDSARHQRQREEQSGRDRSRDAGGAREERSDYKHSDRDWHRDERRDRHRDAGHDDRRDRHRDRADGDRKYR